MLAPPQQPSKGTEPKSTIKPYSSIVVPERQRLSSNKNIGMNETSNQNSDDDANDGASG